MPSSVVRRSVQWVGGGAAFLWVSERDGWRHCYRIVREGGNALLLTPGAFDILSIEAVDEAFGWVYFIASPDDPGQRYLYRARLDGIILWSGANLDCEDTRIPSVAVLSLCE